MARYQVPENLIDQVQILLRKEALLEFFNPNDPSIPSPPTLDEAIAGIGTSDDPLRCKHCKGELLRGSESIICVYCGHGQQQEFRPKSIAFKSTLGFEWLLQSLRLDGSESVGPSIGVTESNREQSSLKDGVALSDFLDLDLKWPDVSKRFGVTNESQLLGERPSNLVGVNLNELFPEESKENTFSVFSEQVRTTKKFETEETAKFAGQKSLNFFAATQSSESVLRSNERENDVSFSGWEAEFQSAVPDGGHEHLHSFEASEGPSAGDASHINPVQGHFEMENSANMSSSHAYPRNDLAEDDLDFNFALPSHSKQSEGSILVEDIGKVEPVDASSGFTCPLDDLQKTAITDPSFVESRDADDSFDQWNDFRSSTDVVNSHCEASTTASAGTANRGGDVSDGWKNFTESISTVSNHPRTNILKGPSDDSLDVWNDLKVSSSVGGIKLQTRSSDICQQEKRHDVGEPILRGNDFASLNATLQDGQDIHADASQNKAFSQDDSVRLWNSVTGMTVLDDQLLVSETKSPAIGTSKEADDSLNLWNDFKSSNIETQQLNSVEGPVNNMSAKVGKTSDVWNDFAGLGTSKIEGKIGVAKTVNGLFASWNDNSFNAWNDLTETSGASVSKPISNDISYGDWNDFSSSAISHTDRDQSSGKKAAESQTVLEHDDSFGSWGNLTGSVTLAENSFPSTVVTESGQGRISTGKACETLKVMEDNIPLDAWGDFGHSVLMQEKHSQAEQIELSKNEQDGDDNDFLSGWIESSKQSASPWGNQVSSNGGIEHDAKSISENDDSFDEWTGFASSSNVPNQSLSSSANAPAANEAVKHDDILDSWNVFTSSSNVQAGNNTIVPEENMPEISLFSSNASSQGVEYESSYQQEMLLRVTSDQNGSSSVVSPAEVPDVVRMENGGGKADDYSEQINRSETSSKGTADLKSSDVEMLISEMHDLSFMLENSLSIPKSE